MDIKTKIRNAILDAVTVAIANGEIKQGDLPEVLLEVPPQKEFGDFATNFAMQSARSLKSNPKMIATAIVNNLQSTYIDKAIIAGPGFINLYLKPQWIYDVLDNIIQTGSEYGTALAQNKNKILLEFVSANPTGPLHVGHGRGAAFGSALANLMRAAGYDITREYYINDAGNQIDNLAASVNARYLELLGEPFDFPADGYHGQDIVGTAQRIVEAHGKEYVMIAEQERLNIFKEIALQEKLAALREDLANFKVEFDIWFSERDLHQASKIDLVCELLQEKGFMYEKDGAKWLKATAFTDDKDRVVIRDNGVPTYLAADIAYHKNKMERGFDQLINIWGADHHGYIPRMKAAMGALGYQPAQLEVLILQMVSLYRDGELVKMSKRTGKSVTLNELVEEVGADAARFFFIMRSIDSQLDFDLTLATEKSTENPVYYVQYAHARICSIFRQMSEISVVYNEEMARQNLSLLTEECEVDLIKKLGTYPEEIILAAADRAPHRMAHFAYELAGLFHSFYNQCRIIGTDEKLQQARLALLKSVKNTLVHVLNILGVSAPDRM